MGLILIVEDNEKNLKLVRDILQVKGLHDARSRHRGGRHRIAAERKPDLVLMDIQLPA
jgi:two-component system cell cycle response regulator DivK